MTREEAIKVLEMFLHKQCDLDRTKFAYDQNTVWEAVNMASKALEQEPCEDVVSRQAVRKELLGLWNSSGDKDYCMETLRDFVMETPSVTPTRKKEKWIRAVRPSGLVGFKCSNCETFYPLTDGLIFCPNCGAEMESEDGILDKSTQ